MFPGLLIDDSGASDFVPKVDSKIRRIKELYRAMKNGLPWKLPIALMKFNVLCSRAIAFTPYFLIGFFYVTLQAIYWDKSQLQKITIASF